MKLIKCKQCGGNEFTKDGVYTVCKYCNSHYLIEQEDFETKNKGISLKSDIDRLLDKCRSDPKRARKYANLILDIDPTNREAKKYI